MSRPGFRADSGRLEDGEAQRGPFVRLSVLVGLTVEPTSWWTGGSWEVDRRYRGRQWRCQELRQVRGSVRSFCRRQASFYLRWLDAGPQSEVSTALIIATLTSDP